MYVTRHCLFQRYRGPKQIRASGRAINTLNGLCDDLQTKAPLTAVPPNVPFPGRDKVRNVTKSELLGLLLGYRVQTMFYNRQLEICPGDMQW